MGDQVRSRWLVVLAYSLLGAAVQMIWLTLAPVTTVAAARYGVSTTTIGWLSNIMVLGCVVLSIPAGLLLDRYFRPILAVGAVLVALGACLRLGDTYDWLLAGYIVTALAQPVILTAITGLARNYVAPRERARGIAVGTGSQWVGYIVAFALGAAFSAGHQLPTLYLVDAVAAVVAAALVGVALVGPMPFKDATKLTTGLRDVTRAWSDPLLRKLVAYTFAPFGVYIALLTWTEALLKPAGVWASTAGVILLVNVVAGIVGTGLLPEAASKRRWEVAIGVLAALATTVGCLALAVAPGAVVAIVVMSAVGLLTLPMLAIMLEVVERLPGHGEGVASGWVWAAGNLGGVVVTAIVGFTVDSPGPSFVLLAILSLLVLPVLLRLRGPLASLSRVHGDADEVGAAVAGAARAGGSRGAEVRER